MIICSSMNHVWWVNIVASDFPRPCVPSFTENCSRWPQSGKYSSYVDLIHIFLLLQFQRNVLIDASGKAVLCDFGLSRIKADATSRTVIRSDRTEIAGTRNWMAPELLRGGLLKKPCDIYAFGMTIYEVGPYCVLQVLRLNGEPSRFLRTKFR